ncbi:methyl-accepting chemotaxis protein [Spirochaeta cellobiosiphila]|uniref:methyl-accepting chemotaxis protein n=1 Tax=Spirochaeta cellobiosiphila TaxID=504483 RepID=UPI00041089BA|nr:methyl-accepting chemotaxis protein [Spirochaeta cellobiosiphila]
MFNLSEKYKDQSYEVRLKVPILFWFEVMILFSISLVLVIDVMSSVALVHLLSHVAIALVVIISVVSLLLKKYNFSSTLLFCFVSLAMGILRMLETYTGPETVALNAVVMGSFLVMSGLFINQRRYLIGLAAFANIVSLWPVVFAFLPNSDRTGLTMIPVLYPLIAMLFITFSIIATRRIFDTVINDSVDRMDLLIKKSEGESEILRSSADQLAKSEVLLQHSQETSNSVIEIDKNISSIGANIGSLDKGIKSTQTILKEMQSSVGEMEERVKDQIMNVSHATAAIEQIVASIKSVGTIIAKEEQSVSLLKSKANEGGSIVKNTMQAFSQVTGHLDNIRGMTSVISKIAAQTNLLAMNAAIEAAHAGDLGRGFAVVAQEIRNLAESSSGNAKEIGNRLKELIDSIETANKQVDSTGIFFQEIQDEVDSVSIAMGEIRSSADELNYAGKDILNTSTALSESSSEMETGITVISKSSHSINTDMSGLVDVSSHITSGMEEISQGMSLINNSLQEIHQFSNELISRSKELNTQINNLDEE